MRGLYFYRMIPPSVGLSALKLRLLFPHGSVLLETVEILQAVPHLSLLVIKLFYLFAIHTQLHGLQLISDPCFGQFHVVAIQHLRLDDLRITEVPLGSQFQRLGRPRARLSPLFSFCWGPCAASTWEGRRPSRSVRKTTDEKCISFLQATLATAHPDPQQRQSSNINPSQWTHHLLQPSFQHCHKTVHFSVSFARERLIKLISNALLYFRE